MDVATEMPKEETVSDDAQRVLCKFQCNSVTTSGTKQNFNQKAVLSPISSSSVNDSFSKFTPSGLLELMITNPAVKGFFEPGESYYIEIRKGD